MVFIKNVKIHHSTAYDLLAGIHRLHNNELLMKNSNRILGLKEKIKQNEEILIWINESRKKLTKDVLDKMDVYFNYETFFGICIVQRIANFNIATPEELINHIKKCSYEELLYNFMCTGYGSEDMSIDSWIV